MIQDSGMVRRLSASHSTDNLEHDLLTGENRKSSQPDDSQTNCTRFFYLPVLSHMLSELEH